MSQSYVETNIPCGKLDAKAAYEALTSKEKKYAEYMARASYASLPITIAQVSFEAPHIFEVAKMLFSVSKEDFCKKASAVLSEEEVKQVLEYFCAFLYNAGNYRGFGDSKFIPRVSRERFQALVDHIGCAKLREAFEKAAPGMYATEKTLLCDENTAYYKGFTTEEIIAVKSVIEETETATFIERTDKEIIVHRASIEVYREETGKSALGLPIVNQFGLHSDVLKKVVFWIKKAQENAANERQHAMLDSLIKNYTHGRLADHKEYSLIWAQDVKPVVETYIGFIETYRDPRGSAAEYESLVGLVDKEANIKLNKLTSNFEELLQLYPWPKVFERTEIKVPDYNALAVLAFTCSGMPLGINLPNYSDVREVAFKNVSLVNVMNLRATKDKVPFIADEDQELFLKWTPTVLTIHVACHELLGHGSGRVIRESERDAMKSVPYPLKEGVMVGDLPLYSDDQCYDGVFGPMSSAMEESRAESAAVYLSFKDEILNLYEVNPTDFKAYRRISCLDMLRSAILGLEHYDPISKSWKQAHCQARFAILAKGLECGAVTLDNVDGNTVLRYDESKEEAFIKGMEENLMHYTITKATGDVKTAQDYFGKLTSVCERGIKLREEVLQKKQPRMMIASPVISESGEYIESTEGPEGVIYGILDNYKIAA